ncbi:hypothetical protein J6590_097329 [Homalodisca vitripennis]|nr:hypothetical protein J6590_040312 [Homalodisca vitripennis]KAG8314233.1 hypothetical protein J6590_097329 [Homalodisca vitripennis]
MLEEPFDRVQPKFVAFLRKAFSFIQSKNWLPDVDWQNLSQSLTQFQKTHCVKSNARKGTMNGHGNDHTEDMEVEVSDDQKQDVSQSESETELVKATKEKEKLNSEEDEVVQDEVVEDEESVVDGVTNSTGEGKSSEESEEPLSEPEEEPPRKKLKKKSDKKKNHEKIKRTQLLKNNSKKMRLEAMAVGLDENIFSKYKMLMNNTSPPSPDR